VNKTNRVAAVIIGALFFAAPVAAQHAAHHAQESVSGRLGVIHFPTSGSPQAQKHFLRGLLLLHSFEYLAARQSFQTAWQVEPGFAMAAWGEALSYNHPLWAEQDTAAARTALSKLGATAAERLTKAPTPRERDYLESVERLYGEGDKAQRDANYSKALEVIARRYPQDLDARSLYALSLLGLSNGKRDPANYMRAAAEVEAVYEIDRRHPAALHYLIHAYDDPVHAPLGLRAARLYGKVAPAASHAQHMPSHIFFALGMWDEAIAANFGSLKTARAAGDAGYHPLLWLEYAYLQKNLRTDALELVRSVAHDVSVGSSKENRLRLAFARATWLVETRGGNDADARLAVDSSGVTYFLYFAVHDFARGISAAAGDSSAARGALAQLRARFNTIADGPAAVTAAWYDTTSDEELVQARALADALDGTIQFYDGKRDAGLARVQTAIDATAHLEFEYGPPWSAKPLDELLGELLLADGRRPAAAQAFHRALLSYPNRRLALEGLAAASATP
jgi:tetratricopeptide (TPR) repeat protein